MWWIGKLYALKTLERPNFVSISGNGQMKVCNFDFTPMLVTERERSENCKICQKAMHPVPLLFSCHPQYQLNKSFCRIENQVDMLCISFLVVIVVIVVLCCFFTCTGCCFLVVILRWGKLKLHINTSASAQSRGLMSVWIVGYNRSCQWPTDGSGTTFESIFYCYTCGSNLYIYRSQEGKNRRGEM